MTNQPSPIFDIDPLSINASKFNAKNALIRHSDEDTLVVDYGTGLCRAGWASHAATLPEKQSLDDLLIFDNYLVKHTASGHEALYGLGALSGDTLSGYKSTMRSPWDHGLPCNLDVTETQLDAMLTYMAAKSLSEKRILWSEPLLMPHTLRQPFVEMFFETYGFKEASFFNDSLATFEASNRNAFIGKGNGTIISLGHFSSTLVPLIDNQPQINGVKRLELGGQKLSEYLLKSMQFKYPSFPLKMTPREAAHVLKNCTLVAERYSELLDNMEDPREFQKWDVALQYPYPKEDMAASSASASMAAAANEANRAAFKEKMKQVAEKKRLERLREIESQIDGLLKMKAQRDDDLEVDENYLELLNEYGYEDERDFESFLAELQSKRNKLLGIPEDPVPSATANADWSLLNVADEELDEEQIKEKRRLKLLKAGMDARERQKKEKEAQAERARQAAEIDDQRRQQDFQGWLQSKHEKRKHLREQIDALERSKSRKSAFAQSRLRNLSFLATTQDGDVDSEDESQVGKKKRKSMLSGKEAYGDDAQDWDRYRNQDPQELQDALEAQVAEIEELLIKYDPSFNASEHPAANERAYQVYQVFLNGQPRPKQEDEGLAAFYQLHVNIERFKIPEILFTPSIVGLECAGITELLSTSHKSYPITSGHTFLAGGLSSISGMAQRFQADITEFSPCGHAFNVEVSSSPVIVPWQGAANWSKNAPPSSWLTREEFVENGYDRLIRQVNSSLFIMGP